MIENGMVGGEGRYGDEQAAAADATARAAQSYADQVVAAIDAGIATADVVTFNGTAPLTEAISYALMTPSVAAQLVTGLSLLRAQKYEQGARVLLEFVEALAKKHGIETAELRSVE